MMLNYFRRCSKYILCGICIVILIKIFLWTLSNDQEERNAEKKIWNWQGFSQNEISAMSNLGHILYLNEIPPKGKDKTFLILIHKYGRLLERRHIRNFGKEKIDPFSMCSVQNCELTYDSNKLAVADAVLIHLHRTCKLSDLPKEIGSRPAHQRWVSLTDEAPKNSFLCTKALSGELDGVFNWSMSYRYDADIPVAYGRAVIREEPVEESVHRTNVENILRSKTDLVAIMISNCAKSSLRWRYVSELAKHLDLTIIGQCGNRTVCSGRLYYGLDCPDLKRFKFYLAFENTLCDQYITEKVWWNALGKGAVPIVMGGDVEGKTYSEFLPPGSYLNVDDFESPQHLAECLKGECATDERLRGFHGWRRNFTIHQEHAYFGSRSVHYCRICEALNYNSESPKVYHKFSKIVNTDTCRNNLKHFHL